MKKIILTVAAAAIGIMAVAAPAMALGSSAGVERYQLTTGTLTASAGDKGEYVHTLAINTNPCDNTFTGTGGIASLGLNERVSGTLKGQNLKIDGEYLTYNTPFTWSYDGPLAGGTARNSLGQEGPMTFSYAQTGTSSFKSHADYVNSGNRDAEALKCIGQPKTGPAGEVAGTMLFNNDSFGLANFTFAGQDGGMSADKGTAFYADKAGHYTATATDVEIVNSTTATMSLKVTHSTHKAVPVATEFTVTLYDAPGARDYFMIHNQPGKQFEAKLGNINVNYR